MREIKFRALELDSPSGINWVYGYYVKENGFYQIDGVDDESRPVVRHYIIDEYGHKYEVVPDTVGRYTEIKDKNGDEIYEDDIVYEPSWWWGPGVVNLHVEEGYTNPESSWISGTSHNYWDQDHIEIIGNKHENPALSNT